MTEISLIINNEQSHFQVPVNMRLIDLLREECQLFSVKVGCEEGECGACTVLLNGQAVNSCLMLACEADGGTIITLEGLCSEEGKLHPLQDAFIQKGAAQCGFCTPGMILAAKALLDENPAPTDSEINQGMAGNFCRCTGYTAIRRAIRSAARQEVNK